MAEQATAQDVNKRAGKTRWIVLACTLVAAIALVAYLTAGITPQVATTTAEPEPAPETTLDASDFATRANEFAVITVNACSDAWYRSYVNSRIIPIEQPTRADVSTPLVLGPWTAEADYGATDARFDGSLTMWNNDYYITHDWSDYGQQILSLWPGDAVTVNGRTVTVRGICNYPKASYLEEIRTIAGNDTVIFQTCYPDSDQNRIVYCS